MFCIVAIWVQIPDVFWILNTRSVSKQNTKFRVDHSNSNYFCVYYYSKCTSEFLVWSFVKVVRERLRTVWIERAFYSPRAAVSIQRSRTVLVPELWSLSYGSESESESESELEARARLETEAAAELERELWEQSVKRGGAQRGTSGAEAKLETERATQKAVWRKSVLRAPFPAQLSRTRPAQAARAHRANGEAASVAPIPSIVLVLSKIVLVTVILFLVGENLLFRSVFSVQWQVLPIAVSLPTWACSVLVLWAETSSASLAK